MVCFRILFASQANRKEMVVHKIFSTFVKFASTKFLSVLHNFACTESK